MKLFYKSLLLTVILAIAAPFILKDEEGRPLMSWDRVKLPDLAAPPLPDIKASIKGMAQQLPDINFSGKGAEVTAYKWQDANGVWHYADKLSANVEAQMIKLDPDANLVHFNQPDKIQSAPHKITDPEPANTNIATALASPLNKAKGVNQLAQERFVRQEQLIAEQSR